MGIFSAVIVGLTIWIVYLTTMLTILMVIILLILDAKIKKTIKGDE